MGGVHKTKLVPEIERLSTGRQRVELSCLARGPVTMRLWSGVNCENGVSQRIWTV